MLTVIKFYLLFLLCILFPEVKSQVQLYDNSQIGLLITGSGNTIEVSQVYNNSDEYQLILSKLAKLDSAIQINRTYLQLSKEKNDSVFIGIFKAQLISLTGQRDEISKQEAQFRQNVITLAEILSNKNVNSERLEKATLLFEAGKITEANSYLKTSEIDFDVENLLAKKIVTDSLLNIRSKEFMIKAKIKELDFSDTIRYDSVRWCYQRSLTISRYEENLVGYATFLGSIDEFDSAIFFLEEAIILDRKQNDQLALTSNLYNISNFYLETNELLKAISSLQEVTKLSKAIIQDTSRAIVIMMTELQLSSIFQSQNNYSKSEEILMKILENKILESPLYADIKIITLRLLLAALMGQNKYEEMNSVINDGFKLCNFVKEDSSTYDLTVADFYRAAAISMLSRDQEHSDFQRAETYLELAQTIYDFFAEKNQDPLLLLDNLFVLSIVYRVNGKYYKSENCIVKSITITDDWLSHYSTYQEKRKKLILALYNIYLLEIEYAESESDFANYQIKANDLLSRYPYIAVEYDSRK